MAEDKEGFILYKNMLKTIEKLAKTENGKEKVADLFITILEYVNDKNPVPQDAMVDIVFEPIKQHLKRDLKKYEKTKTRRSEAGKVGGSKSGEARRSKRSKNEAIVRFASKNEANEADIVLGTVTDIVNVIDTKKSLVDVFLTDLPGSTYFENIARTLLVPKDQLLLFIPPFRKKADVSYQNFERFCNHFKNWVSIELRNQAQEPVKLKNPFPKR